MKLRYNLPAPHKRHGGNSVTENEWDILDDFKLKQAIKEASEKMKKLNRGKLGGVLKEHGERRRKIKNGFIIRTNL